MARARCSAAEDALLERPVRACEAGSNGHQPNGADSRCEPYGSHLRLGRLSLVPATQPAKLPRRQRARTTRDDQMAEAGQGGWQADAVQRNQRLLPTVIGN